MKILLAEDDSHLRKYIKKGLEQQQMTVDLATDGRQAYDLASVEYYDVIILDIMLPEMDGLEVCRQLRQADKHHLILMLTAKDQLQDKIKGLNCGADDYLVKPFEFAELVARIKALSRRPQKTVGQVLTVDDLRLDLNTYEVYRGQHKIDLTKTELALLEYLLRHKNKVLDKDNIAFNAWSYDSDILPNTVQVYIGYLRKKIDKPFPNKRQLIETVRGMGYRVKDSQIESSENSKMRSTNNDQ